MVGKVYVSCNLHHFFQRVHQLYGRTQLRALCRIVSMQSLIASIHALRLSVEPANISKAFLDSINIFPVGILLIINNRFFDALCQINTVYSDVAVIGGGNSGIEAAIDLAGICRKVTVFEFADTLKADQVLQEKAQSLPNVEIFTSSQTVKVDGNEEKVTSIRIKDRLTGEERDFPLDGIFVQIGLAANSAPFRNKLETTPTGEIKIDAFCRTTLPGVYAAGDVSNVPYKQIVIAMGEGAKAALSAFDDRIRGVI